MRHPATNRIVLFDIKTSRSGWNKYQKSDSLKSAQLVAYKTYFSKQFGVPQENIDVEFFIVKRKLIEDSMFPQKRIQNHRPSAGSVTQKKVVDFAFEVSQSGSLSWLTNRDLEDRFFEDYIEKNKYNMSIHKFDVTYTAGRRKKTENGFEAMKAKEVLIII